MKSSSPSFGFFSLSIITLSLFWLVLKQSASSTTFALCLSLFFSVLVPGVILAVRQDIRMARIRAASLLRQNFKPGPAADLYFEFLQSKYFWAEQGDQPEKSGRRYLRALFSMPGDWFLLASCIPFVLLTATMTFLLFSPYQEVTQTAAGQLGANILSVGGAGETGPRDYEHAVTIASFAFAGAFLYCVRLFLRAVAGFNLSALTFLRASVHALFAILLALVIWRAAPDAGAVDGAVGTSAMALDRKAPARPVAAVPASSQTSPVSGLMLLLAFGVGFLPDAGFAWMARKARLALSSRSASLARQAANTPLTAIDGIDFMTAYRLQERGISSVQGLAAANPVMLETEMAAGIFTIMDWAGQAQLCAAVGPQRFFLLRRLNLRTIFDLERAVLDPSAPAGLKQMAGTYLLADAGKSSVLRDFGLRPLDVTYRDFDKSLTAWVSVEVVEHLVFTMLQDLHVKRLRQIRDDIEDCLMSANPGEPRSPPARLAAPAQPYGADEQAPARVPYGARTSR